MNKNLIFLLVAINFIAKSGKTQNVSLSFAKFLPGTGNYEFPYSIFKDNPGNTYLSVPNDGSLILDPGIGAVTVSAGSYLVKYDAAENYQWYLDSIAYSAVDKAGNICVGKLNGDIARYNTNGIMLWHFNLVNTGTPGVALTGIKTDGNGNVYVCGSVYGAIDFDPSSNNVVIDGGANGAIFLAKYDSAGNYLWAESFGSDIFTPPYSFDVDDLGNIYVCGEQATTTDYDPGPAIHNIVAGYYLLKYSSANGAFFWDTAPPGAGMRRWFVRLASCAERVAFANGY